MIDPLSGIPANIDVQPSARKLLRELSPEVRTLIFRLLEVMERSARDYSIPIAKTELVTDQDPEEGTKRIEIRQWVGLSHEAAMDYWEKIGHSVDNWIVQLPDQAADQLAEWVSFAVYPKASDAAA